MFLRVVFLHLVFLYISLLSSGLHYDGLYRLSGNLSMIQKLRIMVDQGKAK